MVWIRLTAAFLAVAAGVAAIVVAVVLLHATIG